MLDVLLFVVVSVVGGVLFDCYEWHFVGHGLHFQSPLFVFWHCF